MLKENGGRRQLPGRPRLKVDHRTSAASTAVLRVMKSEQHFDSLGVHFMICACVAAVASSSTPLKHQKRVQSEVTNRAQSAEALQRERLHTRIRGLLTPKRHYNTFSLEKCETRHCTSALSRTTQGGTQSLHKSTLKRTLCPNHHSATPSLLHAVSTVSQLAGLAKMPAPNLVALLEGYHGPH